MTEKNVEKFDVLDYMRKKSKPLPKIQKDITLWNWLDYWLDNLCVNIKHSTKSSYDSAVKNHIKRVFNRDYKLKDINLEDVQLFVNSLNDGVGLAEPLSPKTVKNVNGVLHRSLDMANRYELIEKNPADSVLLPKRYAPEIIPFSISEVHDFLEVISGHEYELLYKFALFSGLRQGELIALTWDCFDFKANTVRVYRQFSLDKDTRDYYFAPLKNGKPRKIVIAPAIMDIIREHKKSVTSEFVFPDPDSNGHLTHAQVRNAFKRIMRKMGKPEFRFHDLRHTYAVLQIQAGVDIKTISTNMGHYSVGFTLDTYAFCLLEMKNDGAEKIEQLYKEITSIGVYQ